MPHLQLYLLGSVWLALLLAVLVYRVLKERQQIEHLALHDHLTGMPNRRLFDLRLEHALERIQRGRQVMAVLYLDLDGFKAINDRYGHKVGDHVLVEVCWRIHTILRRSDTIARIGGDECLILLEELRTREEACAVADKLIRAVSAPIEISDHSLQVGASIGISLYPDSGTSAEQLINRADSAMYQAKSAGKSCYRLDEQAVTANSPVPLALNSVRASQ